MVGMSDYRWSLGTIIWLPIAALLLIILVGVGWWLLHIWRDLNSYDRGPALGLGLAALGCALLLVGGTAWGMWPYSGEYHQWRTTTGTVEQIDSRIISSGDSGPTERYVVTFDDGRQRSCDDTRCAQVGEGDELTLACKRAWQWSGTHGYDCNYFAHKANR